MKKIFVIILLSALLSSCGIEGGGDSNITESEMQSTAEKQYTTESTVPSSTIISSEPSSKIENNDDTFISPKLIPEYKGFSYPSNLKLAYYKEGETINDAIERLIYNNSKFIYLFTERMEGDTQKSCDNTEYYFVKVSDLNYSTLDDLIQLYTETYTGGYDSFEKENNLLMPPMFIEENGRLCGRKNAGVFMNSYLWSDYTYTYENIDQNTIIVTINILTDLEVIINGEFTWEIKHIKKSFNIIKDSDGIWKMEKMFSDMVRQE